MQNAAEGMDNIVSVLERNAREWPDDVALVEINPKNLEQHHTTWREYSLIVSSPIEKFRWKFEASSCASQRQNST